MVQIWTGKLTTKCRNLLLVDYLTAAHQKNPNHLIRGGLEGFQFCAPLTRGCNVRVFPELTPKSVLGLLWVYFRLESSLHIKDNFCPYLFA